MINVALAANGATAAATSEAGAGYAAAKAINGDRIGADYDSGGANSAWAASGTVPATQQSITVDFGQMRSVTEIDVFSAQDAHSAPSPPTLTMTGGLYVLQNFSLDYWTGSAWAAIPGAAVTANDKIWKQFTFPAILTTKIRLNVTATGDTFVRVVELEAWGNQPPLSPPAAILGGNEVQLFSAPSAVVWSTNVGTLFTDAAATIPYDGVSARATIYLKANNKTATGSVTGGADTATVAVTGVFPLTPDWGYKVLTFVPGVVSTAEDRVTTKVRYKGGDFYGVQFTMTRRTAAAWSAFEAFRAHHRLHLPWYFTDPETGIRYRLKFDQSDYEAERSNAGRGIYDDNNFNCLARKYSGSL
jgi:hypothetical protein